MKIVPHPSISRRSARLAWRKKLAAVQLERWERNLVPIVFLGIPMTVPKEFAQALQPALEESAKIPSMMEMLTMPLPALMAAAERDSAPTVKLEPEPTKSFWSRLFNR